MHGAALHALASLGSDKEQWNADPASQRLASHDENFNSGGSLEDI